MPTVEASGRIEFSPNNGNGTAGASTDFDITVPAGLTDAAIIFGIDWWGLANISVDSVTVDTGTVVEIGNGLNATSGREGGFAGRIMNPSSGTRTITVDWDTSFGTGSDNLKTIAYVILSGVDQTDPVNDTRDWIARSQSSGNVTDSVTTDEDDCSIIRFCHDWWSSGNDSSTISGYTRIADASSYSSAFYLEDAGTAGTKSSTFVPTSGESQLTDFIVAIAPAAGATNVAVGLASETNTAQSITPRHVVDVGLAEETDTAQSITPAAAATIVNVGLASETNAAQSITPSKRADVGLASETNTAQSITPSHRVDVGLATETDSAQAITIERRVTVGLAEETDTAQSVTIERRVQIGTAEETDSALDVQPVGQGSVSVNQAQETDQALSIRPQRVLDVGLAEETDTAQDITPSGPATVAIGLATESNTALPVTAARIVDVGLAEEADSAQPITVRREFLLGLAEETNTALPVDALGTRVIELGLAEETNSAFSMVALGGVAAATRNRGAGAGGNRSRARQSLAQVRGFIERQRDDEEALIMSLLAEDP